MKYLSDYDLFVDENGVVYRTFCENLKGRPRGEVCPMRVYTDKDGYQYVQWKRNKKHHIAKVHRLVALAYVPNPNGYATVDHINRNPSDNRAGNLRWASRKMQSDNCVSVDISINLYGVRACENPKEYHRRYKAIKRGNRGNI